MPMKRRFDDDELVIRVLKPNSKRKNAWPASDDCILKTFFNLNNEYRTAQTVLL